MKVKNPSDKVLAVRRNNSRSDSCLASSGGVDIGRSMPSPQLLLLYPAPALGSDRRYKTADTSGVAVLFWFTQEDI